MPDYAPNPLKIRQPGVPRGTVTRYFIEAGNLLATPHRRLHLYEPPVDDPVPLVVVWDGGDYLSRARLNITVDNLIAQGRIRPLALAFLDNGQQARMSEYFCSDATLAFLLEHLLPFASKHLNLLDIAKHPASYGVMGASMGGLMSLYTALRLPDIFGHVISESGAFFTDPRTVMLIDLLVESLPVKPLKIWQDVGTIEWLLEGNRAMHERLTRKGYRVTYHEYNGGHNYTMWSDIVWRGLEAVFGTK
jgi:enterochelin esterase family protein